MTVPFNPQGPDSSGPPKPAYQPPYQPQQAPYQPNLGFNPQAPFQPQQVFKPLPPTKKSKTGVWIAVGVITLLILGLGISNANKISQGFTDGMEAAKPSVAATTTKVAASAATTTKAAATAGATTGIKDGTYLVGIDIAPGTWKSDGGMASDSLCYAQTTDKAGKTIEGTVGLGGGSVTFKISPDAYKFMADGCGTWKRIG